MDRRRESTANGAAAVTTQARSKSQKPHIAHVYDVHGRRGPVASVFPVYGDPAHGVSNTGLGPPVRSRG